MLSVSYSFVMQLLKGNVPQDEDSMLQLATSEFTIKNFLYFLKKAFLIFLELEPCTFKPKLEKNLKNQP